jgi:hypothetical protein
MDGRNVHAAGMAEGEFPRDAATLMKDFVLDDGFLASCIHLPGNIRAKIVSQLQAFAKGYRGRPLGVAGVEGSKDLFLIPVDDACRIVLRREKSVATLLFVTENYSPSTSVVSKRGISPGQMVIAPVDALEALLVEGKYLLLAKDLLKVPATIREVQYQFSEIERVLNAHLPPEARRFTNWWANQKSGKRAHAFAWMASGWLVSKVDMNADRVMFVRRTPKVEGTV